MMRWIDHGVFYHLNVPQNKNMTGTFTQLPVVDSSKDDVWRIYFSSRNQCNQSQPFFIDIEAANPSSILGVSSEVVLRLGIKGSFDQHGVMPTELIYQNGKAHLYYIGWNTEGSYPFKNSIGLAIQNSQGDWEKQLEPVIQAKDNCLYAGTLGIIKHKEQLFGYYLSCQSWYKTKEHHDPLYQIDLATSADGLKWDQNLGVMIPFTEPEEGGIASARVIYHNNKYHMWYCFRAKSDFRTQTGKSYRIGYAQSKDLKSWVRKDQLMSSFNSMMRAKTKDDPCQKMQCYPYIVKHKQTLFMFYNGNNFGQTGIAYATLALADIPS